MNKNMMSDPNIQEKEKLLTKILIVLAAVGVVMAVINLVIDEHAKDAAAVLAGMSLVSILGIFLNKKGRFTAGGIIVCIAVVFTLDFNLVDGVGLADPALLSLPIFIMASGMILGRRVIPFMTALSIASVVVVGLLEMYEVIVVANNNPVTYGWLVIFTVMLLTSGIMVWYIIKDYENTLSSNSRVMGNLKKSHDEILAKGEQLDNAEIEKSILLKEVHHRVKNNMQIISSLLNLQKRKNITEEQAEAFEELQNRIMTMSLVHEQLYSSENISNINAKQYIENLISMYLDSYKIKNFKIELDLDDFNISIDKAIPLGLLVNEVFVNTYKYAFPEKTDGIFSVVLKKKENKAELMLEDNGIGISSEKSGKKDTFGQILIKNLAAQFQGKLDMKTDRGTSYKILFPVN